MHLVYCISKLNYGITEEHCNSSKLELAAIVWALTRLRQFLLRNKFTIVTDCEALVYINAKTAVNPQIARWFALVQEYDLEVKHRPGTRMAHVNALSQAPVESADETIDEMLTEKLKVCVTFTLEEQLLPMQRSHPEMKELIKILDIPESESSKDEKMAVKQYSYKEGIVYKRHEEGESIRQLFVVPLAMRK
jgi:hypothetical protein